MAVGQKPFDGLSYYQIKNSIIGQEPDYPEYLDTQVVDLIKKLLNKNPEKRIQKASQIKNHPFFSKSDLNFELLNSPDLFTSIEVPHKPKLNFDSETFYFDKKFTAMPLGEIDFLDLCNRENSPTSNST
jgi:serine/threonine protein kinase